jgi:hypothetical protein
VAQNSWPSPAHNSRNVTDPEYEVLAARLDQDGVHGDPNDSSVIYTTTGLQVFVREAKAATLRGHYWTSGPVEDTLPISANDSGLSRTDRVVLRLDRSDWTVRAVVLEGTPGAGVPALTRDLADTGIYEMLLAGVVVPNGATSVQVIRGEQYQGPVRPAQQLPLNPRVGDIIYGTPTGRWLGWTGTEWRVIYDYSGLVNVNTSSSLWDHNITSVIERINGTVHLRLGTFPRLGGNLAPSTDTRIPILVPAAYRHPTHAQYTACYITGSSTIGRLTLYPANNTQGRAGQLWLNNYGSTIATGNSVLATNMSWAVA